MILKRYDVNIIIEQSIGEKYMSKKLNEKYTTTDTTIVKLSDLEDVFTNLINIAEKDNDIDEVEDVVTALEMMREGMPPLYISEEIGVACFNGNKQIKNLLTSALGKRVDIDYIFACYNKILYWPLFHFRDGMTSKEFDQESQTYLKNLTFKMFALYQKDLMFTYGPFITDKEIMQFFNSLEAEKMTVKNIEKLKSVHFDMTGKVKYWFKSAGVVYLKGHYRDLDKGTILKFEE